MAKRAAEAGVKEAKDFFACTPWEISLLLSAHRARIEQEAEARWLAGRYMALAVHAPDRLPAAPAPRFSGREMTDDEMKQRLVAWRGKEGTA